jgi:protein SCO1/2
MRGIRINKHVRTAFTVLLSIAFMACLPGRGVSQTEDRQGPRIEEKLGETIPLDLTFTDMAGNPVALESLFDRPTVLTLVYYRCPNICSPLLRGLATAVDQCDLKVGEDYDLLTISFDQREGPELSKIAHGTILQAMDTKIPPGNWRFMTGDSENIKKITEAVGFYYVPEKEDFDHPTVVMFLTKEGKIVRYLNGLTFLPVDMKMAILDATEGRVSNVMQKLQRLCFSYDAEERSYVLQVNRLILYGTLFLVALFGLYLFVRGRKKSKAGGA